MFELDNVFNIVFFAAGIFVSAFFLGFFIVYLVMKRHKKKAGAIILITLSIIVFVVSAVLITGHVLALTTMAKISGDSFVLGGLTVPYIGKLIALFEYPVGLAIAIACAVLPLAAFICILVRTSRVEKADENAVVAASIEFEPEAKVLPPEDDVSDALSGLKDELSAAVDALSELTSSVATEAEEKPEPKPLDESIDAVERLERLKEELRAAAIALEELKTDANRLSQESAEAQKKTVIEPAAGKEQKKEPEKKPEPEPAEKKKPAAKAKKATEEAEENPERKTEDGAIIVNAFEEIGGEEKPQASVAAEERPLPVTRKYVIKNRYAAVNMFSEYLKSKENADNLEDSINTVILK